MPYANPEEQIRAALDKLENALLSMEMPRKQDGEDLLLLAEALRRAEELRRINEDEATRRQPSDAEIGGG